MEILGGQEGLYDSAMMGILQNCGKLPLFMDAVFSFLARRTDFYIIMQHERARMGFPPGVAEAMVMQAFKKFEILTRKREAEIMREEETKKAEQMAQTVKSLPVPSPEVQDDELPISLPSDSQDDTTPSLSTPSKATPTPALEPSTTSKDSDTPSKPGDDEESPRSEAQSGGAATGATKHPRKKDTALELSSETYNGAVMDNYRWAQTITDLEIRIPVSDEVTGKDVKVEIRNDYLKVELLKPENQMVIDKPLLHRVKVEESMWNLDRDNGYIQVNLEKTKEIMWKSVLEGEAGIDLTKVDTTRNISEFDDECQAAIQRVTYDHHMKMLGKPTSSQKKAHDILKKAWNAEGSPFKGTPFDPSKVQVTGMW